MDGKENRTGLVRAVGEEFTAYCGRLDEVVRRLEWQSEGHRMWYTHKNPYGCWICDANFGYRALRDEALAYSTYTEEFIAKLPKQYKATWSTINIPKSEEL